MPILRATTEPPLDPGLVDETAELIRAAYAQWLADPGDEYKSWDADDVVPLRLIRQALADLSTEYLDEALRQLDLEPDVEISRMDLPTDADVAAAVWIDGRDWAHQIWINAA